MIGTRGDRFDAAAVHWPKRGDRALFPIVVFLAKQLRRISVPTTCGGGDRGDLGIDPFTDFAGSSLELRG